MAEQDRPNVFKKGTEEGDKLTVKPDKWIPAKFNTDIRRVKSAHDRLESAGMAARL